MKDCLELNGSYRHQLDELRARQHDLKNQLAVVRGMLEKSDGCAEGARALASDTGERIEEASMLLKLDNSAVGIVLFNKFSQARERGIGLTLKNYAAELPVEPGQLYDLTATLGSVIDNAIESSSAGDRISVEIDETEGFMVFTVNNRGNLPSSDIESLFSPGCSTKGSGRGFGLSNARSAVLKHGGNIELTADGDRIECRVCFPISA